MKASDIIQLRNLKVHDDISEETVCFSATIVMDGRVVGYVQNDGKGGCNSYHFEPGMQEVFDAAVEKYKANCKPEFEFELDDQMVDEVMEETSNERDMKTKTLFKHKGQTYTFNGLYSPAVRDHILKEYPGAEILNREFAPKEQVEKKKLQRIKQACKTGIVFKLKGEDGERKLPVAAKHRTKSIMDKLIERVKSEFKDNLEVVYNETL